MAVNSTHRTSPYYEELSLEKWVNKVKRKSSPAVHEHNKEMNTLMEGLANPNNNTQ